MAAPAREPALRLLQRNDPATASVLIYLHEETDDPAISRALSAHNGVTDVSVVLSGASTPRPNNNQGWSSLRHVLATNSRLEHVSLHGYYLPGDEALRPSNEIVELFMESVQRNKALKRVHLIQLRIPGPETVAILEDMPSVTTFAMHGCTVQPAHGSDEESRTRSKEEGALAIANALQKNQTIEFFVFAPNFAEPDTLSILQGVKSNKHLRRLIMDLEVETFDSTIDANRYETTIAACLEAASKCQNLQGFRIVGIKNEASFGAVLRAIPHFRMRHADICIEIGLDINAGNRVSRLMKALQRNFRLFSARVTDYYQISILGDTASAQLSGYLLRNERLALWVERPESVPRKLWPEALAMARRAGEETLWQSLLKVGPEVANGKKRRKRKRTQFYSP